MANNLAPIVLFVYNRPEHTARTLEALALNEYADESILYIYADGAKNNLPKTMVPLKETRELLRRKKWCKEVIIIESEFNKGLADSIVSGVSEVVNKHGKVIVLEDDIVTSPGFLRYMNDALDVYAEQQEVFHISGYMYPVTRQENNETVFLRILSCWGWATWKRAWNHYNDDVKGFLGNLKSKSEIKRFNIKGNAGFYEQLLANDRGEIKSWAVKWYASWYFKNGISLFPETTLVTNIGHDGTGVHCGPGEQYRPNFIASKIEVKKKPIKEDEQYLKWIDRFYQEERSREKRVSLWQRIKFKTYHVFKLYVREKIRTRIKNLILTSPEFRFAVNEFNKSTAGKSVKLYPIHKIFNSTIGDYTYVSQNAIINNTSIGKFCSIGPNLLCGWGIHPTHGLSTSPMFYSTRMQNGMTLSKTDKMEELKAITIGNDVFIGMNVTILDGVNIGDGAVIGAGAVVSRDIPPYAIAVGNPIQILKYRFSEEQRNQLQAMKWWDWDEKELYKIEKSFWNVEEFLRIKND